MHLPDGALNAPICVVSTLGAGIAAALGLWRLPDRMIPRLSMATAAFFVVGAFHIRIGPGSVHLLLTGLLAGLLGWRSIVPVAVGVLLQAVLIQHGGLTTAGFNTLVIGLPAMLAGIGVGPQMASAGPARAAVLAAVATAVCYAGSIALFVGGVEVANQRLVAPLGVWAAMHLPVAGLEMVVAAATLAALARNRTGEPIPCATAG